MTTTLRDAIRETLRAEMQRDPDVLLIGENVRTWGGSNKVTLGLGEGVLADRVLETPVSENAIVGAALGAALAGLRPVAEVYSADFLFTAGNEVLNDIPKWRYQHRRDADLCLVLRMAMGGSQEGRGPEHTQCIEGYLHHAPGLTIVVPGDPEDAVGCLTEAVRGSDPIVFLEHRRLYGLSQDYRAEAAASRRIGRGRVVHEGDDVTLVAWGWMRQEALAATRTMAADGVSVEVVDPVTIKPMDWGTIEQSVRKTGHLLVVEEGPLTGSVGAEVLSRAVEGEWTADVRALARLAMPDLPVPYAPTLEAACIPSAAKICERLHRLMLARRCGSPASSAKGG